VTWIVGLTGLFSGGALAGDVRVTSAAGHSFDGVKKVHIVTCSTAVGFAGSVRFGLRAVEDMGRVAATRGVTDFRACIDDWARCLRHAWQRDSDVTSTTDLHLLVVTARPIENAAEVEAPVGVTQGVATAYVLRSPEFAVEAVERRAVSIGSGRAHDRLNGQLASIEGEIEGLRNFELSPGFIAVGGAAAPLQAVLGEAIREIDPRDVSDHLHLCLVRPEASEIVTFDKPGATADAPMRTMPEVARTEAEWDVIAARHGVADALA
jgi:hypothetical protein